MIGEIHRRTRNETGLYFPITSLVSVLTVEENTVANFNLKQEDVDELNENVRMEGHMCQQVKLLVIIIS